MTPHDSVFLVLCFFFLPILVRSFIRTIVWQLGLVGVIYGLTMCMFFVLDISPRTFAIRLVVYEIV